MASLTLDEIDAEVDVVRARIRREHPGESRAVRAHYDQKTARVLVEFSNGCLFGFPVWMVPGNSQATPEELEQTQLEPFGEAVIWGELNADTNVLGMMMHAFHLKTQAAKYLGSATSPAKAQAAWQNGRKGGRPRKQAPGQ